MQFDWTTEHRRSHGIRAGRARGARFAHVIEDNLVSTAQIARRLGVSPTTAYHRARRAPFPLAWKGLTESKTPRSRAD